MKKIILCVFVLIFLISLVSGGIRINEVMPHTNSSYGNEWIELYNNESNNLSLVNWTLEDTVSSISSINFSINISANGYALIVEENINCSNLTLSNDTNCIELAWLGSKLNDGNESLRLYNNNSNLTNNLSWTTSIKLSGKSWSYDSTWKQCTPTPGSANNCVADPTDDNDDADNNNNDDDDIKLSLDWEEDDIINGEEFEIEVDCENLENEDYDIKIEIKDDDDKIISQIYDEENEKWLDGSKYFKKAIDGPGDEKVDIKIRIKSANRGFDGKADMTVKIRENGKSTILDTDEEDIDIIEAEEDTDDSSNDDDSSTTPSTNRPEIISLTNSSNTKTDNEVKNSIIYKSKSEYIKEYAVYGFALLCIFLIALLLIDK